MRRKGVPNPLFEVQLNLAVTGSRDSARTLYRELKDAILEGRLLAGARLPPVRQARAYFGVSRNTAAGVYEKLINEGYGCARQGSGTYVAERVIAESTGTELTKKTTPDRRLNAFWHAVGAAVGIHRRSQVGAIHSHCGKELPGLALLYAHTKRGLRLHHRGSSDSARSTNAGRV